MANKWIQLIEAHVEKGILAGAVLFMLAMLYLFLIENPNTREYGGREVGPAELDDAIKSQADRLAAAVRSASAEVPEIPDFAKELNTRQDAGIFVKDDPQAPELPAELPLAAGFGGKIEVPGLEEAQEAANSVTLVTPLRPSKPELRTGRSLVVPSVLRVASATDGSIGETPGATAEPVELPWVSVAAYFDKKGQYREMVNSGYAPFRSRAYVVGVEVERQEMLSDGAYSEWLPVRADKAMPQVNIIEPVFDADTGELINKGELRDMFGLVKQDQQTLMQPPFFAIEEGDFWEVPPLEGHEDDEDEDEAEEEDDEPQVASGRAAPRPTGIGGRGRTTGGGTISGLGGGRGGRSRGGSARGGSARGGGAGRFTGGGGGGAADQARAEREARKQLRDELKEAKKLLGQRAWQQALGTAESVRGNAAANAGMKREAKKIIEYAERRIKREQQKMQDKSGSPATPGAPAVAGGGGRGRLAPSGMGGGRSRGGGGRFSGGRSAAAPTVSAARSTISTERPIEEFVTHPETNAPAVWFHDDTVEAGKTYRYRVRVLLWNRYVGRVRALKDPEAAKQSVVAGLWSFPSDPVTVTPSTHFFVRSARDADQAAWMDVWKWRRGRWIEESFDVAVGDVIGGIRNTKTGEFDEEGEEEEAEIDFTTGAIVLDIRYDEPVEERVAGRDGVFSYRQKNSAVLVYLDPADGQVKKRVQAFDRRDPLRKELEDQAW